MKNYINLKLPVIILMVLIISCKQKEHDSGAITIENAEMRLIISREGYAKSLLHKATGQECLNVEENIPAFAVKLHDRLPSQEMLVYPFKTQFLPAESVRKAGDKLLVTFEKLSHVVTFKLTITDNYIGFSVDNVENRGDQLSERLMSPLDEIIFLRLPVRNRDNFGEWLNVIHDKDVAVNVLGTDQYCNIDSEKRHGFRILEARAVDEIKTLGVGAALIVTDTKHLLDRIEQLETDFNLPPGVKNRRNEESKYSYYWARDITPENADRHIRYARAGGFKLFMISCNAFAMPASFTFLPAYSNGIKDLKGVVDKINDAGMIAGVHLYSTKADKRDIYVTGKPDHRLGLRKIFTLAEPITESSTVITVEENPERCTMQEGRRILKTGDELVAYDGYTTERPFQFFGCERGHLQTKVFAREKGFKFGLLDVDTWVKWVRFDQQTSIQQEVAERIGEIYNKAGFRFIYLDGAEDVNLPYWYNISLPQKIVFDQLDPAPVFTEGAARTHFSWHILDRGNAFDLQGYPPAEIKDVTRRFPMREAPMLKNDFSKGEFGWVANHPAGYWDGDTVGVQPDMIEYSTSRAAGWDTGTSLWTQLSWSDPNPRTADIFEVFNRWETVREKNWLTEDQKAELRNPDQEHILLITENGDFELSPYYQITQLPTNAIRAFHFRRDEKMYVVFWHTTGEGKFLLPLKAENIKLFDSFEGNLVSLGTQEYKTVIPAEGRRYLEFINLTQSQVIEAFRNLRMEN